MLSEHGAARDGARNGAWNGPGVKGTGKRERVPDSSRRRNT